MGKSKKTEEKSKKTEMAAAPTPKDPPKKEKEKERDIQPTQAQTPASKTPAPISQASQQQPKGISRTAPTPMPPPIKSTKEFAPKESNASNVVDNTGTSTKVGESEDVTRTQSKKTKKGGSCCTIL
ncbi:unnamed protein product [Caenorhabditis angaria]|uniref:Uncharacterized protein n=1 Tax=Caenorhabditis angaria TaxID=860376 RepID=A0A9P1IHI1_9PELO|nr:unnamed protein product [Caenorhabditis angaria]